MHTRMTPSPHVPTRVGGISLPRLLLLGALISLLVWSTAGTGFAAAGNLPGGTSISATIDSPADGAEFTIPVGDTTLDVPVSGTASVGEGAVVKDTTVAYVVDRSGSTAASAGVDCDGAAGNDNVLTCEKQAVNAANTAATDPQSAVDLTGLASFNHAATSHDVDLGPGMQLLVSPQHDGNGNTNPDVVDVVNGLAAGGGTNFEAALNAAKTTLEDPANDNAANLVVFLTDGFGSGNPNNVTMPANTTIKAFAIGSGSACTGNLIDVANRSTSSEGGSCEHITDISKLADAISEAVGSTLDSLTLSVDGVPTPITNTDIDPDLPQDGPANVTYNVDAAGLGAGSHEICVTATGTDAGGSGSVTDCVTVHLFQGVEIDIKPGSDPNSINLRNRGVIPVAILTTDTFDASTVDPASVCFGDAEEPTERDCTEAHGMGHLEDVDGDGDEDLVLHFETQETGIDPGDTEACLRGTTTDGTPIEGCDSVRTVPTA